MLIMAVLDAIRPCGNLQRLLDGVEIGGVHLAGRGSVESFARLRRR